FAAASAFMWDSPSRRRRMYSGKIRGIGPRASDASLAAVTDPAGRIARGGGEKTRKTVPSRPEDGWEGTVHVTARRSAPAGRDYPWSMPWRFLKSRRARWRIGSV